MRNLSREWQAEFKQTFTAPHGAGQDRVPRLADGNDHGFHLIKLWVFRARASTVGSNFSVNRLMRSPGLAQTPILSTGEQTR